MNTHDGLKQPGHLRSSKVWVIALVVIVFGLPITAHYIRGGLRDNNDRCHLTGIRIDPEYRVRVVGPDDASYNFCCIRCAVKWSTQAPVGETQVFVTDESSGREIKASEAFWVRSVVVTNQVTGNRIHAFALLQSAENHARHSRGTLLTGPHRPFVAVQSRRKDPSDD